MVGGLLRDRCVILQASNGKTGIRLASKYTPDLIICDVMMPDLDGLEVCRRLKSEISTSHIPILMLTACSLDEQRIETVRFADVRRAVRIAAAQPQASAGSIRFGDPFVSPHRAARFRCGRSTTFKVNVQTDGSGKVSLISVTVYDSLELMCGDVCLDLRLHAERGGYFKYKKEKEDVLIDFL